MNKIVWTDDFTVGVKEIDNQHKKITEVFNGLIDQPNLCSGSEAIGVSLDLLTSLFSSHFVLEEHLMKKNALEQFDAHKAEHEESKMKIAEFCAAVRENQEDKANDLLGFLCDWWESHMREEYFGYKDDALPD